MKVLYIHAGLPKNGSSALQVFFAKNINNLKNNSIDYFELENLTDAKNGGITSGNGALLSRWLLNDSHEAYYKDGEPLYQGLFKCIEKSDCDIGLISSEFFINIPQQQLLRLKEDLFKKGVLLKFIYYVRRQDQFLASNYMQRVKRHGLTVGPEDFVKSMYKNTWFLKYHGFTKHFEDLLGKGNVKPYIYETTKGYKKGIVGHFMESILGYCPDWVEKISSINTSPSILELKFMLCANRFSPRMRFSDFLIEDSVKTGRSTSYANHSILSAEVTKEILDFFNDQNLKFEKEYANGEKFDRSIPDKEFHLDEFTFSPFEVLDIISGFLVRYDNRLHNLESRLNKTDY